MSNIFRLKEYASSSFPHCSPGPSLLGEQVYYHHLVPLFLFLIMFIFFPLICFVHWLDVRLPILIYIYYEMQIYGKEVHKYWRMSGSNIHFGTSFDALCKSSDKHTVNLSLFFESDSDNLRFFSGRPLFISSAVMDSKGYQSYQKWSVGTHNSHSRLKHVHNEAN